MIHFYKKCHSSLKYQGYKLVRTQIGVFFLPETTKISVSDIQTHLYGYYKDLKNNIFASLTLVSNLSSIELPPQNP